MRLCAICKQYERAWTWQPFGPDDGFLCFTLPGAHYRGFAAIAVCNTCKNLLETGETVTFTHKRQRHTLNRFRHIRVEPQP